MAIKRRKRSESLTPDELAKFKVYITSFTSKIEAAKDLTLSRQAIDNLVSKGRGKPESIKLIRSKLKKGNYISSNIPTEIKKTKRSEWLTVKDFKAFKKYVSSFETKVDACEELSLSRPAMDRILSKGTGSPNSIALIKNKLRKIEKI